jgi:hypothetical protein
MRRDGIVLNMTHENNLQRRHNMIIIIVHQVSFFGTSDGTSILSIQFNRSYEILFYRDRKLLLSNTYIMRLLDGNYGRISNLVRWNYYKNTSCK